MGRICKSKHLVIIYISMSITGEIMDNKLRKVTNIYILTQMTSYDLDNEDTWLFI